MTTLYIRGIPEPAIERIKRAAAARQWTLGQYLDRLSQFHDRARARAECDPAGEQSAWRADLTALGLETVRR